MSSEVVGAHLLELWLENPQALSTIHKQLSPDRISAVSERDEINAFPVFRRGFGDRNQRDPRLDAMPQGFGPALAGLRCRENHRPARISHSDVEER